jgi:segregation and condensation protein A
LATAVRDLDLDLEAFQGPFDLLLTLVLKEELELADVEIAEIVLAFLERFPPELEPSGEFLVLVAALLELKARGLFPEDEDDLELDPDEAAEELAERLAEYRRFKEAAAWLERTLEAEHDRFFRMGPAPLAPAPVVELPRQDPTRLAQALRALAAAPREPSLGHLALTFPPVSLFLERFRAALRRRGRFVFDDEVARLSRVEQAVAFLALLELRKSGELAFAQPAPFEPIAVWSASA